MIFIADGTLKFDTKVDDSGFVEGIKNMSSKQIGLQNSIKKTQQEISKLEKSMDELKTAKVPTQEYQEIQKQIEAAQKKLNGYLDTEARMQDTGADLGGMAWKNLQWRIEDARQTIGAAKADLKELESSGNAFTVGGDTSKLTDMQNKYDLLTGKLNMYKARLAETASKQNQQSASSARVSGALNKLSSVASKSAGALMKVGNVAKSVASGFGKLVGGIGRAAKGVISGIGNITKLFGRGQKSANGYGTSIKSVVKSMILYQGVSKILGAVANTMWTYLKTNTAFVNSLATVKGNLFTAFQPIYTAVMPAINALMQIVVKATGYLAQFTSMLFGKTVSASQKAAKAQYGQAKALEDTSKAAKEANKQLSGLDELNNITDSGSSGSGGGGADDSIAPDFDTPIETSGGVSEFVERLKEAWRTADFTEIGTIIAGKINGALEGINWDTIQGATQKVATSIYTFINGFVGELDWSTVGSTIGNGINTAIDFVNTLVSGIDWSKIGTGLGAGFDNTIKTINWSNAGLLISNGLNSVTSFINNFYKSVDWVGFGSNIASSLNTAVSNINWSAVGQVIGNGLNMAIQSAYGFITTFDWKAFGQGIADGINGILTTTDWITLAKGASKLAIGLLDTISTAIKEIDWQLVGNTIGDMIANIDWLELAGKLIDLLVDAFNGLVSLVFGIGESIGKNIAEGLADGISLSDIIKNAATWVNDHIFKPIVDNIKKLFGIHSPSKVMTDIGTYIMQGMINGIVSLVNSVKEKFKTLVSDIKDFFTGIPAWFEGKFNDALSKIKSVFSASAIKTHFENVLTNIKSVFSKVSDWFDDTFSDAWQKVKDVFSTGGKIYDGIKEGIGSAFKSVVQKLIDGINVIIRNPFDAINGMLNTIRNISILGATPFSGLWKQNPISVPKIPALATGTVVPKNYGDFLAILGDNKREAEVVSPLSTMKQAFREELNSNGGGGNGDTVLHITLVRDGKKEYEETMRINKEQAESGNLSFAISG